MITVPALNPAPLDQNKVRTGLPFAVDYRRAVTDAASGQTPTYTRSGSATVSGRFGGTFAVGVNRIPLSWVTDGIGYLQTGGAALSYAFPVTPQIPTQVAWDGIVVAAASDTVLWRIGTHNAANSYFELRKVGGASTLRAIYSNASGDTSVGELTGVTLGSRLYAVARLVPSGGNVQARLSIKLASGSAYTDSALGTARSLVSAWAGPVINVMSLNGSSEVASVMYRGLARFGSDNINDLPWGW